MEASCLEIASVISVLLKDALALIRIVNAARSSQDDKNCVSSLFRNMKAVEAWAQTEWWLNILNDSTGYYSWSDAYICIFKSFVIFLSFLKVGNVYAWTSHERTAPKATSSSLTTPLYLVQPQHKMLDLCNRCNRVGCHYCTPKHTKFHSKLSEN